MLRSVLYEQKNNCEHEENPKDHQEEKHLYVTALVRVNDGSPSAEASDERERNGGDYHEIW
jgi:hypothetical protein